MSRHCYDSAPLLMMEHQSWQWLFTKVCEIFDHVPEIALAIKGGHVNEGRS
jgi:hypothetical protein